MQTCKTGDQPYSDASPNCECSLVRGSDPVIGKYFIEFVYSQLYWKT